MAYNKTNWVANQTLVSAENLNKIEDGIKEAHEALKNLGGGVNSEEVEQKVQEALEEAKEYTDEALKEIGTINPPETEITNKTYRYGRKGSTGMSDKTMYYKVATLNNIVHGRNNVISLTVQMYDTLARTTSHLGILTIRISDTSEDITFTWDLCSEKINQDSFLLNLSERSSGKVELWFVANGYQRNCVITIIAENGDGQNGLEEYATKWEFEEDYQEGVEEVEFSYITPNITQIKNVDFESKLNPIKNLIDNNGSFPKYIYGNATTVDDYKYFKLGSIQLNLDSNYHTAVSLLINLSGQSASKNVVGILTISLNRDSNKDSKSSYKFEVSFATEDFDTRQFLLRFIDGGAELWFQEKGYFDYCQIEILNQFHAYDYWDAFDNERFWEFEDCINAQGLTEIDFEYVNPTFAKLKNSVDLPVLSFGGGVISQPNYNSTGILQGYNLTISAFNFIGNDIVLKSWTTNSNNQVQCELSVNKVDASKVNLGTLSSSSPIKPTGGMALDLVVARLQSQIDTLSSIFAKLSKLMGYEITGSNTEVTTVSSAMNNMFKDLESKNKKIAYTVEE